MHLDRIRRFTIGLVAIACIAGLAAAAVAIGVPPELTLGAGYLATRFLTPAHVRTMPLAMFVLQLLLVAVAAGLHLAVLGVPVAAAWLSLLLVVAIYRALRPPPAAVWIGIDLGAGPDRTAMVALERRPGRRDQVVTFTGVQTFTAEPRAPHPA